MNKETKISREEVEKLARAIEIGKFKLTIQEMVSEPYDKLLLSFWEELVEKSNGRYIHRPKLELAPEYSKTPFIFWANSEDYISVFVSAKEDVSFKRFFFYRNRINKSTISKESNDIPDDFLEMILNIVPDKEDRYK